MNSTDSEVKVILTSTWTIEESGVLPARIVLWKREGEKYFIVHMEVKSEAGNYFTQGNYDLTINEALKRFNRRAGEFGCEPIGQVSRFADRWLVRTSYATERFLSKEEASDFRDKYLDFLKS